jgi:pimeloyl-ACP methyl ester carboxylesterase
MDISVNGKNAHAATGGFPTASEAPALILIHGAGMDATVWQLQSRYLAHRNVRVFAVDLPGHGGSEGPALESISDMADWIIAFMDAAGIDTASVTGHSMGSLISIEVGVKLGDRVSNVGLLGSAAMMPVHPDLIKAAEDGGRLAPGLITDWGFGDLPHKGGHPQPGLWAMGAGEQLVRDATPGVLAKDLIACNDYKDAETSAAKISAAVHVISGDEDKMTPVKNAKPLMEAITNAQLSVLPQTGHMMMIERPRECAKLLLKLAS